MQLKVKYKTVSLYEYLANMRTRKEENAIFKKFGGTIWVQGRQSDFFFQTGTYKPAARDCYTLIIVNQIYFVSRRHFSRE